ncbi:MAG: GAF domain-containing sensor histidine kinase [Acidimicrobiales bacterium]
MPQVRAPIGTASGAAAPQTEDPAIEPIDPARTPTDDEVARVTRLLSHTPAHRARSLLRPMARVGREGDGPESTHLDDDQAKSFRPVVIAVRWGTTAVSLALAVLGFVVRDWTVVAWCGALVAYTIFRSISPVVLARRLRTTFEVILEVSVMVTAVVSTGGWTSPFGFAMASAVIVAGFARGFGFALRIGAVAALTVTLTDQMLGRLEPADAIQWTVMLLLVALIAGYTRRISGEADRQHHLALDRLERLSDANALLFALHRVAQTLPASLDMKDVLDTTVARLRGLFEFDYVHILLFDETDAGWHVLRREGATGPDRFGPTELPSPLKRAIAHNRLEHVADLSGRQGPGTTPTSGSGLYSVLLARGALIGLLAIEHRDPSHFSEREVELLNGFVEPVALAIDNARWFGRLRTVGADEERTRIARDLHDRIGQSLAYLGFELDRIIQREGGGEEITDSLARLREDVRGTVREVRDTLYDIRTDVSDEADLVTVLDSFADRLMDRSDITVELVSNAERRLPMRQEREIWRIAQEALVNVERHAEAERAVVTWAYDGTRATLEVIDNGRGFQSGAGRTDSYGLVGMRERASSIGASLEIVSQPGRGTTVRCVLGAPRPDARGGPALSAGRAR